MRTLQSAIRLGFLLALATTLTSCSDREGQLVGKWTGELSMPDAKGDDPMAKFAQALMGNVSLDLKEDKSFTMTIVIPIEGTWSLQGDVLTLMPTKVMGMTMDEAKKMAESNGKTADKNDMNQPMEFSVSGDGKTLTAIKKSGAKADQGDLVFKKSAD
jgi:hypothetical protein